MENFKIGDIVARKSYNFDILFKIVGIKSNGMIDLVGLTVRIIADAPEYDLKHINKEEVQERMQTIEKSRMVRLNRCYSNMTKKFNNMNSYYPIREPLNIPENPNMYQKDTVFKKPRCCASYRWRFRIYRKV